jgi:LmbE family N-acetylglucosaminyl deacetylase
MCQTEREEGATAPIVLAVAAHPDDIEFMMAGTLLRLKAAGAAIHMWNLANGHCGTARESREAIIRIRASEAEAAARQAGATWHAPLFDDLAVFYDGRSLARVAAVVRDICPTVVLTQSPQDYMEDHQNTCRLVVTAVFGRGMRNFVTDPPRAPWDAPVALYHALPHGLRDGLGQAVRPDFTVDIGPVLDAKRDLLACHRSQKEWLDDSQGMDAYLAEMAAIGAAVGRTFGGGAHAEGWRRHNMLGFGPEDFNPLADLLKGAGYAETAKPPDA